MFILRFERECAFFFSFTRLYAQCTVIFSYGFKMFQSTLNKCISRHISVASLGSNEVIRVCNDHPVGPQKIKNWVKESSTPQALNLTGCTWNVSRGKLDRPLYCMLLLSYIYLTDEAVCVAGKSSTERRERLKCLYNSKWYQWHFF